MSIKEHLTEEKAKLKAMNFKEKREYILEYYRYHIIGVLIGIILAGALINTYFINPQKDTFMGVAVYGPYVDAEGTDALEKSLSENLDFDRDSQQCVVTNFFLDDNDPNYYGITVQKFAAMCMAGEIDLFIGYAQEFQEMLGLDLFLDLSGAEGLDFPQSGMLLAENAGETGTAYPIGIPLGDFAPFENMTADHSGLYLGITANNRNTEISVEAANFIIKNF